MEQARMKPPRRKTPARGPTTTARKRPPRLIPQLFHLYAGTRVCCGPGEDLFASINTDGRLKLWELASGQLIEEALVSLALEDVAFDPGGLQVACSNAGGDLFFYDVARQRLGKRVDPGLGGSALRLAFHPAGGRLAVGGDHAALLDTTSQAVVARGAAAGVGALAWAPDGERLYAGGVGGELRSLRGSSLRALRSRQAHPDPVRAVAVSPDGALVASGGEASGAVMLWDATSLSPRGRLAVGESSVLALAFAPNGQLAAGGNDGVVRIFDPSTGGLVRASTELPSCVHGLAWSSSGRRLVAGICDGSVARLDASSLAPLISPAAHELAVEALCVSPQETWIALVGCEEVYLWSPSKGEMHRLGGLDDAGKVGAFSSRGEWLAVGTAGDQVLVWSTTTRSLSTTLDLPGTPERLLWQGDAVVVRFEDGSVEAFLVSMGRSLPVKAPKKFPDPRGVTLASGVKLSVDPWNRLRVQDPGGLWALLHLLPQGERVAAFAVDAAGRFDADEASTRALGAAGLATGARSGGDVGPLRRPGLLSWALSPSPKGAKPPG